MASRRHTRRVRQHTPVPVTAVVTVVDPKSPTVKGRPSDVVVLTTTQLVRWLHKRPAVLTAAHVARLFEVADQPGTWRDHPIEVVDAGTLRTAFTELHREVREVRLVRLAWPTAVGGTGVALGDQSEGGSCPVGTGVEVSTEAAQQ